jgi:D-alanine-D-alanine ligase
MHKYQTQFIEHSKIQAINTKGKKHIALIAGGMSAEREVSLSSAQGVLKALLEAGYQVTFIDMGADIGAVLAKVKPDIVYNCLHGTYGEDGSLPGLLNIMRIPYTHSGVLASSIAFSKLKSKELFIANNLKTPEFAIVNKSDLRHSEQQPSHYELSEAISGDWAALKEIAALSTKALNDGTLSTMTNKPFVIKPLNQGSSIGVEIISPEDNFDFADYDFPYGDQIIVEEYIKGREMQVAVLNGKALGVLELKFLKRKFYDYDSKYTEGFTEHLMPAPINQDLYNRLLAKAEKAYSVIGCRGLARVEFIYNEAQEEFFIIELNTHSGMTPLSICSEIAAFGGMDFVSLVEEILATAVFET